MSIFLYKMTLKYIIFVCTTTSQRKPTLSTSVSYKFQIVAIMGNKMQPIISKITRIEVKNISTDLFEK